MAQNPEQKPANGPQPDPLDDSDEPRAVGRTRENRG